MLVFGELDGHAFETWFWVSAQSCVCPSLHACASHCVCVDLTRERNTTSH